MKSDYDEIIRDSFAEKIEVPPEYQQKIAETLKQARIALDPKNQYPADKYFPMPDKHLGNFSRRHGIFAKTCLSLAGGMCACLGFAIILSVLLKQDNVNNIQKQYAEISATPMASEHALTTEIPADTVSPHKTKLPDATNPDLPAKQTQVTDAKQKNDTNTARPKNVSTPDNNTTTTHKKDTTATPKRSTTTRPQELAQVQTSNTPETVEVPQKTVVPANVEKPVKTQTPGNNIVLDSAVPTASATPNSGTSLPAIMEVPTASPAEADTMPSPT